VYNGYNTSASIGTFSTFPLSAEITLYIDLQLRQCGTLYGVHGSILYFIYTIPSEEYNLVYYV
jgi:hypothetical protein